VKLPPPKPAPPPVLGLPPPAQITADKATQVPTNIKEQPREMLAPQPPKLTAPEPPKPEPPKPQAAAEPPKPEPPKPEVKPEPPKPAPSIAPQTHSTLTPPVHVAPPQPRPEPPRPSTLAIRPAPQAMARAEEGPPPSPFVNPADSYNRARVQDNYLWQVIRKLQGYHYYAKVEAAEGTTVVRVVIARDGRLLQAEVARSSGYAAMDQGVLAGVRAGSPYTPLPDSIAGSSATFMLPLVSVPRGD
jgi:protein TonB